MARMINDNVTFTCTATGIPLPIIKWMDENDNSDLMGSDMIIDDTTIQSTLTLSNLQDDDFDNYTCTATNMFSSDDVTALLGSELHILYSSWLDYHDKKSLTVYCTLVHLDSSFI